MASLSPKKSPTPRGSNDSSTKTTSGNSTLSDSLKVNLSSLTLNDTDDFESHSLPSTTTTGQNPKLDRAFLAELQKEIYKNHNSASNVNMNMNINNAQSNEFPIVSDKESTVNVIGSNWLKNEFASTTDLATKIYQANSAAATQSPAKYSNESFKKTNFDDASANSTFSKKLFNSEANSADPNGYSMAANQLGEVLPVEICKMWWHRVIRITIK